jgi:hypothetical protein
LNTHFQPIKRTKQIENKKFSKFKIQTKQTQTNDFAKVFFFFFTTSFKMFNEVNDLDVLGCRCTEMLLNI